MTRDWFALEKAIYKTMVDHKIPGAAVAISKDGEVIYSRGFGLRDRARCEKVDPDTVFGIASITKSFTAMAVMQLVDRGLLSLDEAVTDRVPEFRPNTASPEDIKIHHLLSHTGGLPPLLGASYGDDEAMPDPLSDQDGLLTSEALLYYLKNINARDYRMHGRPDEYFSYSNPGFVVASAIIERVTGHPFYTYLEENIFRPIGMDRTFFDISALERMQNVTHLYANNLNGDTVRVEQWPNVRLFGASGGIKSSANDLIKYASVYARGGTGAKTELLSEPAVRRMINPVYRINRVSHYGFALQITPDYSGYTLCEHGGSLPGVSSTFGFVPEAKVAAVVLTNVQNAPAADIWLYAVNSALGFSVEQKRSTEPQWDAPPDHFDRFAGAYRSKEGADIRISVRDEKGFIAFAGEEHALTPTAPDYATFDQRGQICQIRFFFRPDNTVYGMFFGTSMSGIRLVPKTE